MTVGVDISKHWLDAAVGGKVTRFANDEEGIAKLLTNITGQATVAMEATGRYHRALANNALDRGHRVYVLNPKDVQRYIASTSPRASTDPIAAKMIAEFASIREHRAYQPNPELASNIKDLARTRTRLVVSKVANQNQLLENPDASDWLTPAIDGMKLSIDKITKHMTELVRPLPQFGLLRGIPGFGDVVSSYILALLLCGCFVNSDSFVAFLGLDTKVKQSGKKAGKRCLTKRGDPEARRLLYLAARAAVRTQGPYQDVYNRAIAKGWTKTEAAVIVSRKLARTAWAIYTRQQPYSPDRVCNQPPSDQYQHSISARPDRVVECTTTEHAPASQNTDQQRRARTKHYLSIDNST